MANVSERMKLIEKIFTLKNIPPFDRIHDNELTLISNVASVKEFSKGEIIAAEKKTINRLYIIFDGKAYNADNQETANIIGIKSLLFDIPFEQDIRASDETGAACLWITNGHFFTIIHECPEVVLGFLGMRNLL